MASLQLLTTSTVRITTLDAADYGHYKELYSDNLLLGLPYLDDDTALLRWFDDALSYSIENGIIIAMRSKVNNDLIGIIRVTDWDREAGIVNIGYVIKRSYWGQGIMYETLSELIPWLMQTGLTKPLNRVQCWVIEGNIRSENLLIKLGFTHEGTLRSLYHDSTKYHNVHIYGLLHSEIFKIKRLNC